MAEIKQGYNGNDKLKQENTKIQWTQEMVDEFVKCANDPIYWAEKYIKIISVDDGVIPIKLYDYQREIITATMESRKVIVLTGR